MKFLLIGDLHLGKGADDPWIQNLQMQAIDSAIEYSKENNIDTWVQLGDIFDVRKHTSTKCLEFTGQIMQKIASAGIFMHTIVGNHDMFYKEKISPNTPVELLSQYKNIKVHEKPTNVEFGNISIAMIPWICQENSKEIFDFIKTTDSEYCVGHFELNGFYFYKNVKSHGLEPDFLKKFKNVWTGHFHTISKSGNVHYLGTPYTLTAGDENDPRGFWVFDTESKKLDFIENPIVWHQKIFYPSDKDIDIDSLKNISVRCVIEENDKDFTKFEAKLESVVHELKVISSVEQGEIEDEEIEVKNVMDLMNEYVDSLSEDESNKTQIKKFIKQMYAEVNQ